MKELKVDLNNVGKTRYLYHEIFQIKDYQEIKINGKLDEYREQLDNQKRAESEDNDEGGVMWGTMILMLGTIIFPMYEYYPWLLFLMIALFIARMVFLIAKSNITNKEKVKQQLSTEELSKTHPFFKYYYNRARHYEYYNLVWKFDKLTRFLDKLDEYDDITIYELNEDLNYPTKFDVIYRRLMFKDNKTGQFFIYAYSENDGNMTVLTIFDIDIDTFEYKPRTV